MIRTYDRHGDCFAIRTGHGRDPEVGYLDVRLPAIATSELGTTGWRLYGRGVSYNVVGGERRGDIDSAALHRMAHSVVDIESMPAIEDGFALQWVRWQDAARDGVLRPRDGRSPVGRVPRLGWLVPTGRLG